MSVSVKKCIVTELSKICLVRRAAERQRDGGQCKGLSRPKPSCMCAHSPASTNRPAALVGKPARGENGPGKHPFESNRRTFSRFCSPACSFHGGGRAPLAQTTPLTSGSHVSSFLYPPLSAPRGAAAGEAKRPRERTTVAWRKEGKGGEDWNREKKGLVHMISLKSCGQHHAQIVLKEYILLDSVHNYEVGKPICQTGCSVLGTRLCLDSEL